MSSTECSATSAVISSEKSFCEHNAWEEIHRERQDGIGRAMFGCRVCKEEWAVVCSASSDPDNLLCKHNSWQALLVDPPPKAEHPPQLFKVDGVEKMKVIACTVCDIRATVLQQPKESFHHNHVWVIEDQAEEGEGTIMFRCETCGEGSLWPGWSPADPSSSSTSCHPPSPTSSDAHESTDSEHCKVPRKTTAFPPCAHRRWVEINGRRAYKIFRCADDNCEGSTMGWRVGFARGFSAEIQHPRPRPCVHNDWDDVRTRKGHKVLRCRVCTVKWRLPSGFVPRCLAFLHNWCAEGESCKLLHVNRKKVEVASSALLFAQEAMVRTIAVLAFAASVAADVSAKRRQAQSKKVESLTPALCINPYILPFAPKKGNLGSHCGWVNPDALLNVYEDKSSWDLSLSLFQMHHMHKVVMVGPGMQ